MSSVALLLGLLVVAYVGSHLIGENRAGYRLPSGAEYLLLGIALGPYALGVVERSTLRSFEPLAVVATAWLTLVIGSDYGYREERLVAARGAVFGIVLAALTALSVAYPTYLVCARFGFFRGEDLALVAAGTGLVAAETTRHVARWVAGRYAAAGPLTELVADLSESDDLVPVLGIAVLFPAAGGEDLAIRLPFHVWAVLTPVVGVVLGATAAALLRSEPRASDGWGVIIGAVLLATGIAWRLGLAPQAATFALGLALSVTSRHGKELRAMLAQTEQAVLLPTLVLVGAQAEVAAPVAIASVVAVAVAARLAVRFGVAPVLAGLAKAKGGVAPALAVGLLPTGALSITIALAFASRFPGSTGNSVLAVAVALALIGEAVGPRSLRRALEGAGEIAPPTAEEPEQVAAPTEATS